MIKRTQVNCPVCHSFKHTVHNKQVKVSERTLIELKDNLINLKSIIAKNNSHSESKLDSMAWTLENILNPPKKNYVKFQTINGFASFKIRKKKSGGRA